MKAVRHISITEKLILYFLVLGIGAIMIIGYYSFNNARKALMTRTFDQLTSVRNVRKMQIENFFNDRIRDIEFISKSKDAEELLSQSYNQTAISEETLLLEKYLKSSKYYKTIIVCNTSGTGFEINTNVNGEMEGLKFKLITDSDNNICALTRKINEEKRIIIRDYVKGDSSLFIGIPLKVKNSKREGAVILEISGDAINNIMLESSPENGLGMSGESYLAGSDFMMRSQSRLVKNSFHNIKVKTAGVISAFANGEGFSVINDYRNIQVLSSYRKLNIPGLSWVILAEIDMKEAMIPIYNIRNNILFFMVIIAAFIFLFAFLISKRITLPIIRLNEAIRQVAKGKLDIDIKSETSDEIGALTDSFNIMTKRLKQQADELKKRDEQRISFVIDGQEIERQRLSRELHDGLGQSLIAVKLLLESTEDADLDKTRNTIKTVKDLFDNTINETRRISNNLMPAVLDEFGLVNALRNLCDDVSDISAMVITFNADNINDNIDNRIKRYIYRITQEALNNIVKHSNANKANVLFSFSENLINLNINDNGKGFDCDEINLKGGNGLHNIRERVNLLHGKIKINSSQGKGTEIDIKIPIKQ